MAVMSNDQGLKDFAFWQMRIIFKQIQIISDDFCDCRYLSTLEQEGWSSEAVEQVKEGGWDSGRGVGFLVSSPPNWP